MASAVLPNMGKAIAYGFLLFENKSVINLHDIFSIYIMLMLSHTVLTIFWQ